MRVSSHSSLESSPNVTPLVDVCLVLLIIFMVIMPTIVNGVPVKLPVTEHGGDRGPRQLEITVKDDGTVYLGTVVVRKDEVASELQRIHAKSPDRNVAVRGDQAVPYGQVVAVLDACRAAGYDDVRLVTRKRQ